MPTQRRVASPEGARRYGVPVGQPIPKAEEIQKEPGKATKPLKVDAPPSKYPGGAHLVTPPKRKPKPKDPTKGGGEAPKGWNDNGDATHPWPDNWGPEPYEQTPGGSRRVGGKPDGSAVYADGTTYDPKTKTYTDPKGKTYKQDNSNKPDEVSKPGTNTSKPKPKKAAVAAARRKATAKKTTVSSSSSSDKKKDERPLTADEVQKMIQDSIDADRKKGKGKKADPVDAYLANLHNLIDTMETKAIVSRLPQD